MIESPVRVGTRGSQLALAQAHLVVAALERSGAAAEIVVIETAGDRRAPDTAWGEGAFVAAIERALLAGEVDIAVHSAKDVPTDEDPRLRIAALLPRADPRDALVVRVGDPVRALADLPFGSRVGTDSPRRTGFLLARRPDLRVHPLHGNVDTRLRRLDAGETDALVLAVAGLERLGRAERIVERLDPAIVPPAPGQGAIAVQVRADDDRLAALAAPIDDRRTRVAIEAERSFLARSGGGCRAPIGAFATIDDGRLRILGGYALADGSAAAIERIDGPLADRDALVAALVERLARSVPGVAVRPHDDTGRAVRPPEVGRDGRPRVLVTRPPAQAAPLVDALRALGVDAVTIATIEIAALPATELHDAFHEATSPAWIVVTSPNGAAAAVGAIADRGTSSSPRWAAVGPATADALAALGVTDVWLPPASRARAIGETLPLEPHETVLVVRAERGDPALVESLQARGARVTEVVAYRTIEGPMSSRGPLVAALADGLDAVIFASGSAVRGLVAIAGPALLERVRAIPAIVIGPATADVAREEGFVVIGEAARPDVEALALRTAGLVLTPTGAHR
ncbi:MAG: hydroxymethylbilane synthase [Candidatus Limnocylindrales bacterium]